MSHEYRELKDVITKVNEYEHCVFYDGDDLLNQDGYLVYHPYTFSVKCGSDWRNLKDIKKIVGLTEKVTIAQIVAESIVEDLEGIGCE